MVLYEHTALKMIALATHGASVCNRDRTRDKKDL